MVGPVSLMRGKGAGRGLLCRIDFQPVADFEAQCGERLLEAHLRDSARCSEVWFQGALLTSRSNAPYAETMTKPFFSVNSYYPQLR